MGFEKKLIHDVSGGLWVYDDGSVDETWTGPPQVFLLSPVPQSAEFAIHDVVIDSKTSLSVCIYVPERQAADSVARYPILLHLHGEGFCISHADFYTYYQFYAQLVKKACAICVSVHLRLVPDHRLPAAVEEEEGEGMEPAEPHGLLAISLHALGRTETPMSMTVKGKIQGEEVIILIDSGSTHNFVNSSLVERMGWATHPKATWSVQIADGSRITCTGICKGLELEVENYKTQVNLYQLKTGGTDVILGVQWLRELGDVICNWKEMTMKFTTGQESHLWVGLKKGETQLASCNQVMKSTGLRDVNFLPSPVPPSAEFVDGVAIHNVVMDSKASLSVCIYVSERQAGESVAAGYPILLHFRRGGFCISHADWYMYYQYYPQPVKKTRAICVSVHLHLAPEHRRPAVVDDGHVGLLWLKSLARGQLSEPAMEEADFSRVFLVGDSSGGNLVHEVAKRAGRDELSPLRLAGGIPIHPGFVRAHRSQSELELEPSPFLTLEMVDSFLALALPVGSTKDHLITCPMWASAPPPEKLKLPPFLVVVAEKDMIRDTEFEHLEAMKKAVKEVEVLLNPGMGHSFYLNKMAVDWDPETAKLTKLLVLGISDFMKRRSLPKTLAGA